MKLLFGSAVVLGSLSAAAGVVFATASSAPHAPSGISCPGTGERNTPSPSASAVLP
ncbi:hypothetical protein [Nonomuraea sp. 3-1Str]|uniref:hypothetical protein n=1 Tax=unclassified Nonomuraea TaxID=2593643 RepID=UPI0028619AF6|nr:hypothetical protein [Nonomuraea sp. 3-1Str]MDR8408634.1 hypothetical protein [Nonomuraea sp. 3-1Str]